MPLKVPHEKFRVTDGPMASSASDGPNGYFIIPIRYKCTACIQVSNGLGWEHVSMYVIDKNRDRTPTWEEMCIIKDRFWEPEDVAVQYHPAKSQYVNNHPHVLHMWRPTVDVLPVPDPALVGIRISEDEDRKL